MDYEDLRNIIRYFSTCNPDDSRHGLLDKHLYESCADFIKRTEPGAIPEADPLTLEEWCSFRECNDVSGAYARKNNAIDPWVFLFVLRDTIAYTAGGSPIVVTVISGFIDSVIDRRCCEWITLSGMSPLEDMKTCLKP